VAKILDGNAERFVTTKANFLTSWQRCQRHQGSCHDFYDIKNQVELQAGAFVIASAHAFHDLALSQPRKGLGYYVYFLHLSLPVSELILLSDLHFFAFISFNTSH
jgi:hypothetical protein